MGDIKYIGRIGGLAVALGIGAGVVAMPTVAQAEPTNDRSVTTSAGEARSSNEHRNGQRASASVKGSVKAQQSTATATDVNAPRMRSAEPAAPVSTRRVNATPVVSVSINGVSLIGNSATSTKGSIAVVVGTNSTASATGTQDFALVIGNNSTASVTGNNSRATVIGNNSTASASGGTGNTASVRGNGSTAMAGAGNDNIATVKGDSSNAYAGISPDVKMGYGNNNNTATAINNGTITGTITASAGVGTNNTNNTATVTNNGSITGDVKASAGDGGGNTNNTTTVTNNGSITTLGGRPLEFTSNTGTEAVPASADFVNNGTIIFGGVSTRATACVSSAVQCMLFAVTGVAVN